MKTHGQHGTRLYRIWRAMRSRCLNPNHPAARNYSARGIYVCARWADFEIFADTLQRRLSRGIPLDAALTPGRLNAAPLVHGTRSGYELHKCICDLCRSFNTERARNYRATTRLAA